MTELDARKMYVAKLESYHPAKQGDERHKKIIDIYNAHKPLARGYKVKYTDSWCATTISSAAIELGWTDIIPTECSCGYMVELFKKSKVSRWEERDAYVPQVGDIIMYTWDDKENYAITDNTGWPDHVGAVTRIVGTTITVIEGNKSKAVGYRTIQVNGKGIRGYCLPAYHLKTEVKKMQYRFLEDIPDTWEENGQTPREIVKKLIDVGIINGYSDGSINLSEDLFRGVMFAYRGGAYDKKLKEP